MPKVHVKCDCERYGLLSHARVERREGTRLKELSRLDQGETCIDAYAGQSAINGFNSCGRHADVAQLQTPCLTCAHTHLQ